MKFIVNYPVKAVIEFDLIFDVWSLNILNIYFIRHAQSEANKKHLFSGITDVPLTDKGRASLDAVRDFFKGSAITTVYSSPLSRCKESATIVFGNKKLIVDERLIEINFGDWENRPTKKIIETYSEMYDSYINHWPEFSFPNGDAMPDYIKRAATTIQRILDTHNDADTIVIVSHSGFIRSAISHILVGDASLCSHISIVNGKVQHVEVNDGNPKLRLINR